MKLGEVGPQIAMDVVSTVASGGATAAEAGVQASREGYKGATGESFEHAVGSSIADKLAPVLGHDDGDGGA